MYSKAWAFHFSYENTEAERPKETHSNLYTHLFLYTCVLTCVMVRLPGISFPTSVDRWVGERDCTVGFVSSPVLDSQWVLNIKAWRGMG